MVKISFECQRRFKNLEIKIITKILKIQVFPTKKFWEGHCCCHFIYQIHDPCQRYLQAFKRILILSFILKKKNKQTHEKHTELDDYIHNFHRCEGWHDLGVPMEKNSADVTHLLRLSSFVFWFVSSPIAKTRNLNKWRENTVTKVTCFMLNLCHTEILISYQLWNAEVDHSNC